VLRQAQQPCFDKLSNRASTSSATVLRQAQHKRFGRLSNIIRKYSQSMTTLLITACSLQFITLRI